MATTNSTLEPLVGKAVTVRMKEIPGEHMAYFGYLDAVDDHSMRLRAALHSESGRPFKSVSDCLFEERKVYNGTDNNVPCMRVIGLGAYSSINELPAPEQR